MARRQQTAIRIGGTRPLGSLLLYTLYLSLRTEANDIGANGLRKKLWHQDGVGWMRGPSGVATSGNFYAPMLYVLGSVLSAPSVIPILYLPLSPQSLLSVWVSTASIVLLQRQSL
jgi:hypothetical protein